MLVLQHQDICPPAWLGDVLDQAGIRMQLVALHEGAPVPGEGRWSGVATLGGAMGAYEEADHPFLVDEKRFLRRAADAGVPVLGICLGAQLLADALGGRAFRGGTPELGYHPVRLSRAGERDAVLRHLRQPLLSWHQDTFELPPGAKLLAASAAYPQAFRRGEALGVQFHPETPPSLVRAWVEGSGREGVRAWGADPDALLEQSERLGEPARRAGWELLGAWASGLRAADPRGRPPGGAART